MSGQVATRLIRPLKPWVIPGPSWQASGLTLSEITSELNAVAVIAKPSNNMYLGYPVGNLDAVSSGLANLASHGEMAVSSIHTVSQISPLAERLINTLPTRVDLIIAESEKIKIGLKNGKFLNHFGYRKFVMNLMPITLIDHAWIASALSYSIIPSDINGFMFDPVGGGIAGGTAAITTDGSIFRGSAVADTTGIIISADDSLKVSLAANGVTYSVLTDKATIDCNDDFVNHPFFIKLVEILKPPKL